MFNIDIHKLLEQFVYHATEPMIFNSGFFLLLFAFFIIGYALLQKGNRVKIIYVTLFSIYFYYKSSGWYFLLLLATTGVDFQLAAWIDQQRDAFKRKALLILSLVANLGVLGYFKYTNFLFELITTSTGVTFHHLDIFLPVGISFFTFQSMSYTIDVYRRQLKPVNSLLDYAFFVSFFPQLVAGPIVRASDFLPQIHRPTLVTQAMLGRGVYLIGTGLFKKAVISNYISLNFVDRVFDAPSLYSGLENLFGLYGYALQIYCDFSGYSDMAIGIALLLGFHFNENFRSPYQAPNITDFWRRWHISLSTWLKDYLYISLGGNRKGIFRTYLNLIITMVLGGLWHGASGRFILWGALHGFALATHKYFLSLRIKAPRWSSAILQAIGVILTFHFVCFCWIFFRAENMELAGQMLYQILYHLKPTLLFDLIAGYPAVVALMVIGYVLHFVPVNWEEKSQELLTKLPLVGKAAFIVLVIVLVMQTKSADIQPFIYFQF
ncbi:MAG: MBOAT family O-acyltransferase [Bacteroidota bacterium]|jgi:alginate O-acetyltransferase complex protein AlgI|nr:MBOAT family protein [Cytophagales bacterium]MCZ8072325.1 MBOAT family protein [Cytophagales bacterium]